MIVTRFRPVTLWPHGTTPASQRRSRWTFKAAWSNTLPLLDREVRELAEGRGGLRKISGPSMPALAEGER